MDKIKRIVCLAALMCGCPLAFLYGQTQYDVLVKSAFSPVIQDAQKKITFPARIVDTATARPQLDYPISVRPLSTHFTPEPIKAPRVGKDAIPRLYQHYVKAGAGYLQPLLEYNFNTLRSTRHSLGLHLYTHTSWNPIKDCAPAGYSENSFDLFSQQYRSKFHFREDAGYSFDRYHCYGYQADSIEKLFGWSQDAQDIVRSYHRAHASVQAFTPSTKNSMKLNRRYMADYGFLMDNFHSMEHMAFAGARLDKRLMVSRLDMFRLAGDLSVNYIHNDWDTNKGKSDTWIFRAAPGVELEQGIWNVRAALAVSAALENSEATVDLFPDVHVQFNIVPEILSVFAAAEGGLYRDAFQLVSKENPFLAPMLDLGVDRQYKFHIGTRTNLSNSLIFGARVGTERHSAMAFYMPDTTPAAFADTIPIHLYNTFGISHAAASVNHVHLDVTYLYRESLRIGLNADYNTYLTDDTVTLYYKPQYVVSMSASYLWKNKILVGTDWVWKGGLFAPEFAADGSCSKVSLPEWFDWSLNAEYIWSRRFRIFAELNNIIGRRNQMYANYYTERFNCLFGVKYIFGGE